MEIEVTSNRPDCMGHLGVARELAAGLDRPLKRDFMPSFTGTANPPGRDLIKVGNEDPGLCRRDIGGVIKGVKVGPSPSWLQRRLRACGVRPINNLVDITNYVLLEYAQPLHVFDLSRLEGAEIRVRRAQDGEKLLSLDGIVREFTSAMLAIADAKRPVAIAGGIGGEETAVTGETTDVLLEAATFNGPSVRQTARAFGLRTEASARFERGLPPELALAGARRGAALMPSIDRRMDAARDVMAGAGFTETWNPALVSGRKLEALRIAALAMRVSNALSDDMDTLRTSLLPSLVDSVALNRDRGRDEVRVYEVASAYLTRVRAKNSQPEEPLRLAAVATAGSTADSARE